MHWLLSEIADCMQVGSWRASQADDAVSCVLVLGISPSRGTERISAKPKIRCLVEVHELRPTRCNALMVRMISDHFECVVPCTQPTRAVNIVVFERKKIVYMVHCGSAGNMPHVRLSKICRRCGVRHTCDVRNCIVSPIFTSLISETFPSNPFSISMLLIESSRA